MNHTMLIFSEIHNWQNCESVKQIHVFASEFAKSEFYAAYAHATKNGKDVAAIESYSDTGNGVAYKVRAVLDAYGQWIPLTICGHTGQIIWESDLTQNTWQAALGMALGKFQVMLVDSNIFPAWSKLISASKAGQ